MKHDNIISLQRQEAEAVPGTSHVRQHYDVSSLATRCNATVQKLYGNWQELLTDLSYVGMAGIQTRSRYATFEMDACYPHSDPYYPADSAEISVADTKTVANIHCSTLDWYECYAVREKSLTGTRHRIRLYDDQLHEVHAVTLLEQSDQDAWQALLDLYSYESAEHAKSRLTGTAVNDAAANDTAINNLVTHTSHDKVSRNHAIQPFHGFKHLVTTSMINREVFVDLLVLMVAKQLRIQVAVGNSSVGHEGEVVFDRYSCNTGVIRLQGEDSSLSLDLPDNAVYWVLSGTLCDDLVSSIEVHDTCGDLIVRFSAPSANHQWRSILSGR